MESLRIEILNPKARGLIKNLADLELIRITKDKKQSELKGLLKKFRLQANDAPSLEEITREVELVRNARYEKHQSNT